jgi:hypothetical protein
MGRDYLRDGSMVPDGSMMPFPMPPFDMICMGCTCTEYMRGGANATKLEESFPRAP